MTALRDFEDVLTDVTGGNIKTLQSDFSPAGQFPIVDQGKELIAGFTDDESRVCRADLPVVVFGDHTKCFKFIDFPFCLGADGTKVLRPSNGDDPKYLFHYLRQIKLTDAGYSRHYKYLKEIKIPLPPLAEQRRIAAILDAADALRQQRRQALCLLDQLSQSIFLDMFGDPATNPKGWPSSELSALILHGPQNGIYKPSTSYGEGTPILRIDAFYDGRVTKLDQLKRLSLTDAEIDTYGLLERDLVINRVNSVEYLGKSAIIPPLAEPVVFESNMMRFRINENVALPVYVIQYLQTVYIKSQIKTKTKDAVNQSSINQTDVGSFIVRVPPLALQSRFAGVIAKVEALKPTCQNDYDQMQSLFASLQHRAFRGEL
jgi:type I restriction enzyme, S subunit